MLGCNTYHAMSRIQAKKNPNHCTTDINVSYKPLKKEIPFWENFFPWKDPLICIHAGLYFFQSLIVNTHDIYATLLLFYIIFMKNLLLLKCVHFPRDTMYIIYNLKFLAVRINTFFAHNKYKFDDHSGIHLRRKIRLKCFFFFQGARFFQFEKDICGLLKQCIVMKICQQKAWKAYNIYVNI